MEREGGGMPPPTAPPLLLLLLTAGLEVEVGIFVALLARPWGPLRAAAGPEKPFWCGGRRGEAVGGGRCLGDEGEGWGWSLLTPPSITPGLPCTGFTPVTSLWCWPEGPFMSP